jgi:transmembrane sensor
MNIEEIIKDRTAQYKVPGTLSKKEAHDQLMKKINETDFGTGRSLSARPVRFVLAAAAGLLFMIGLWFAWNQLITEDIIAARGNQTDYQLPDGSRISLNADTKLSFRKGNFNKKREVSLDGEAFFNVEKGGTFTVLTSLANIKVLGTSFNVYARENTFRVSCFSGKVRVTSGSQSVEISAMQMAVIRNNELVLQSGSIVNATIGWRTGEFYFENAPLNQVFDEIERQYNVTLILPDVENKYYTGIISNKNLVNALDIVCIPMGLTYEIGSNSRIYIRIKME